ncbi:MAG TPA: hypothetical protein VGL41_08750 [Roseiarcus sp.]|jgi:hypothetical protein
MSGVKLGARRTESADDILVVGSQYYAREGSNQFEQLPGYAAAGADPSYQLDLRGQ